MPNTSVTAAEKTLRNKLLESDLLFIRTIIEASVAKLRPDFPDSWEFRYPPPLRE